MTRLAAVTHTLTPAFCDLFLILIRLRILDNSCFVSRPCWLSGVLALAPAFILFWCLSRLLSDFRLLARFTPLFAQRNLLDQPMGRPVSTLNPLKTRALETSTEEDTDLVGLQLEPRDGT